MLLQNLNLIKPKIPFKILDLIASLKLPLLVKILSGLLVKNETNVDFFNTLGQGSYNLTSYFIWSILYYIMLANRCLYLFNLEITQNRTMDKSNSDF
jgi:hypothetical protein